MPSTLTRKLTDLPRDSLTRALTDAGGGGGGGGAPFDPLTAFAVWDASSLANLSETSGGTVGDVVVTDPVGKALDLSGGAHSWLQATSGKRPILRQSGAYYYFEFDGSDDELLGTITGATGMSISIAAFRTSDDGSHVLAYSAPASGGQFIGVAVPADGTSPTGSGAGSPAYYIDGAQVSPLTRGTYNTAFSHTVPHVVQFSDCDLLAWPAFGVAGYNTLALKGGIYACVLHTSSEPEVLKQVGEWLAAKCGASVSYPAASRGYAIGDSTIAAYLGQNSVPSYVTTAKRKRSLAVPGDTIAMQRAIWDADPYVSTAAWVVIQVGLNDLDPSEAASIAIARLQSLVTKVRTDVPAACKVLVSKMTPCRARLITLYGGTNGPIAYQKWLDMNAAIAGTGPTPITGVDGRVTAHEPLLNDGSGNLAAPYEISGVNDGIHENNAGRAIVAQAWTDALNVLGVL